MGLSRTKWTGFVTAISCGLFLISQTRFVLSPPLRGVTDLNDTGGPFELIFLFEIDVYTIGLHRRFRFSSTSVGAAQLLPQ